MKVALRQVLLSPTRTPAQTLFNVKICGIRSIQDAHLAMLAGADAIGLNFFAGSKRVVDLDVAEKISKLVQNRLTLVGVFVNASLDEINESVERCGLDLIQLHGDEPAELIEALEPRPVMRAFRLRENSAAAIRDYLEQCTTRPACVLVDSFVEDEYGGTGTTADWDQVAAARDAFQGLPLVLAGGLTPFNVTDAIEQVRPDAVDTASGVESGPGVKDPMLVRAFVNSALKALQKTRE